LERGVKNPGRLCPLARRGKNRGKKSAQQAVFEGTVLEQNGGGCISSGGVATS